MNKPDDFYRILQVHHLAEPEVIEGAYRKLAKKYHPDAGGSTGTDDRIKKINRAYEVLHDPEKRRRYDLDWKARFGKPGADETSAAREEHRRRFAAAGAVLEQYFGHLQHGRFDAAYALVSDTDKQHITYDDFESWRRAVSVVFHLKEYGLRAQKSYVNKPLGGRVFKEAAEFGVRVREYNAVMDAMEKNTVTKMTVLEDGVWRVYVGFEELQSIIDRFQALTDLLAAKSIISELADRHSKIDKLTGLLNRKGLTERIESEIYRFERYGNVFSFVMVHTEIRRPRGVDIPAEVPDQAVKTVGQILSAGLRRLDVAGRWDDTAFLLLLPETAGLSAAKVVRKLGGKLRGIEVSHGGKSYAVITDIACAEYRTSLHESLERIDRQLK